MSMRDEWEFQYTAAQLADAAEAQMEFRVARIKVWEDKKAEVIARIRESGIDVSESIADKMSSAKYQLSTHSDRGPVIRINSEMRDDLSECVEKITNHTKLRNEYAAWVQLFRAQPPHCPLKLQHDDWMYFFGK
jgi:hypothetical protein